MDRRVEKFIEITNDRQEKSQKTLDDLLDKVGSIDERLVKMNAASDQVRDYVSQSEKHAIHTAKLFLVTVVASALIVVGTLWWSHHITSGLAQNKADLVSLDAKLKHMPVIVHFHGKDYVRIIPDSETGFSRSDGGEVPGKYGIFDDE